MPEIHLGQPEFAYSACGPFTKNIERTQKFKETRFKVYLSKWTSQSMIAFMVVLKIWLEKQLLIKYYVLKSI